MLASAANSLAPDSSGQEARVPGSYKHGRSVRTVAGLVWYYQLSTWQDPTGCFIPVGSITVRDWPRLSVMP
jgi:hypothetical protein